MNKFLKFALIVVGAILLIGFLVKPMGTRNKHHQEVTTSNNNADVTLEKFNKIELDWSYYYCTEIMGSEGKLLSETKVGDLTGAVYTWDDGGMGNMILTFTNNKLINKSQAYLK